MTGLTEGHYCIYHSVSLAVPLWSGADDRASSGNEQHRRHCTGAAELTSKQSLEIIVTAAGHCLAEPKLQCTKQAYLLKACKLMLCILAILLSPCKPAAWMPGQDCHLSAGNSNTC